MKSSCAIKLCLDDLLLNYAYTVHYKCVKLYSSFLYILTWVNSEIKEEDNKLEVVNTVYNIKGERWAN